MNLGPLLAINATSVDASVRPESPRVSSYLLELDRAQLEYLKRTLDPEAAFLSTANASNGPSARLHESELIVRSLLRLINALLDSNEAIERGAVDHNERLRG